MNAFRRHDVSTVQFSESHSGDAEYVNQLLSSGLTKLMDLHRPNGTVDLGAHADEQPGYANPPSAPFLEYTHEQRRSQNITKAEQPNKGPSDPNECVSPS